MKLLCFIFSLICTIKIQINRQRLAYLDNNLHICIVEQSQL